MAAAKHHRSSKAAPSGDLVNGRYRLVRLLGEGAHGVVWLADDRGTPRALKVLRDAPDAAARAQLAGEFQRASGLRHPSLAVVHDLDVAQRGPLPVGACFFTADVVDGVAPSVAFAALAPEARAPWLLGLLADLAGALAQIHAAELVHHDVKADNVLVTAGSDPGRAVLLDLGLATLAHVPGLPARGTLTHLSPEALAGEHDARVDLWALGVTAYALVAGRMPFGGEEPAQLVRAILAASPPSLAVVAPWMPAPIATLLHRLLAPELHHRPASALGLLDEIAAVRETLGVDGPVQRAARSRRGARVPLPAPSAALLPPVLVERAEPLARLGAELAALAAGRAWPRLRAIGGAPGVGKSRLLREALRARQLAAVAGRAPAVDVLEGAAAVAAASGVTVRGDADAWADAAWRALSAAPARPIAIWLAELASPHDAALTRRAAAEIAPGPILVLAEDTAATFAEPAWILSRLDLAGARELVSSMLGGEAALPPVAWLRELHAATGGVPRLLEDGLRAAARAVGDASRVGEVEVEELLADGSVAALCRRHVATLAPAERQLLAALAVWDVGGAPATVDVLARLIDLAPAATWAQVGRLAAEGLVVVHDDDGVVRWPSRAHAEAQLALVAAPLRKRLHRAALAVLPTDGDATLEARAHHAAGSTRGPQVAALCLAAGRAARARGALAVAAMHLDAAATLGEGKAALAARLEAAEVRIALGAYDAALADARRAVASRSREGQRRGHLLAARAHARRGAPDDAERELARLLAVAPDDEEARGELARLLVRRGRHGDALAVVGALDDAPPSPPLAPARALRLEAAALAALYLGEHADAAAQVARLRQLADAAGDAALVARATSLRGLVAHARGDLDDAAAAGAEASAQARAAGEPHLAATAALSAAAAQVELGAYAQVLELTERALFDLTRLGHVREVPAAMFNRGVALLALGDLDAAAEAARVAEREATARQVSQLTGYVALLEAEVARRRGARHDAAAALARAVAVQGADARLGVLIALAQAELAADADDPASALAALADARGRVAGDDDAGRVSLTSARLALRGVAQVSITPGELTAVAARLTASGRREQAVRAHALAARLAAARGDHAATSAALAAAHAAHAPILAAVPPSRRAAYLADPELVALDLLTRQASPTMPTSPSVTPPSSMSSPPPLAPDGERSRRLFALTKRLNAELRPERLLDEIIDAAIELTGAERGFLLLADAHGALTVRVARRMGEEVDAAALTPSRSIAEQAMRSGAPVVSVDALGDERFGAAASVGALHLRSVVSVPLAAKGRVLGALYLDHRFRRGAFDDAAAQLALDLADVAAIALENARLLDEGERARAEIAALNARLAADLAATSDALDSARAQLAAGEGLALRHAYDALVGRSPRMVALLRLVDRATASALPVVIHGESGTGKELIARALHANGPRQARPFVAINCAAMPEALLESELLGHVRGAFTGADRDRRGLFEMASGGTLLLDEIADMSLAMQAKLLRVLQDGEVRPVGGDRARKVDVRVIAAANRDLAKLVADGKFREDLFYRLHVIRLDVPPLRERTADIPALVEHVLERVAETEGAARKRVDRAAMARLVAYPWPGNVRELENELRRAAALGDDVVGVADLSPAIAAAEPPPAGEGDGDLALRPRLDRLELTLLKEAMSRASGNQTQAAKLLGLSRFGLQKKLRRYGLG